MKTHLLLFVFLLVGLVQTYGQKTSSVAAYDYETYYSGAIGLSGDELKLALHDIIDGHIALSYSEVWDALCRTDEDPDNADHVILLYTGWSVPEDANASGSSLDTEWNREHTWAKTYGDFGTVSGPGTDLHHLRPTDVSVNSARGSLMFDNADEDNGVEYVDDSYYYDDGVDYATGCYYDSNSWEPRDEVKGDVARMLFYMAVRYEGDSDDDYGYDLELAEYCDESGLHGKLSTLLEWNSEDPVSDWERTRNDSIYAIQGNRNPFIDNQDWVDEIDWASYSTSEGDEDTSDYIFYEDFEDSESLDLMTGYSVTGDDQIWYYASYSSNNFAKMSGYESSVSTTFDNEDWLISASAIDLSEYSSAVLSFMTMKSAFSSLETSLYLKVSTDYDGSSSPTNFVWTDLTNQASWSTGGYNEVESGDVDLSAYVGQSIYIAFQYISTTAEGSDTWEVDDIAITGTTTTTAIDEEQFENLTIFPNPASHVITITADDISAVEELRIINQTGKTLRIVYGYTLGNQIEISDLSAGLYFIQIKANDGKQQVLKLLVN